MRIICLKIYASISFGSRAMPALLAVCVQHELLLLFIYKGVNGVMAFCVIIFELREHRLVCFKFCLIIYVTKI